MENLKQLWSWLRWPAAIAILGWLAYSNWDEFESFASRDKNWWSLAAALFFCGGAVALVTVRWYLLVWGLDLPFRLRDAFRLNFLGLILNYAGPGLVGGDMFKAVFIAREQPAHRTMAAATVFLDRVLGLQALLMLGALATLFVPDIPRTWLHQTVFWMLWGASGAGILGLSVILQPRVTRLWIIQSFTRIPFAGKIFASLLQGVGLYQERPRVLWLALSIGLVSHTALIVSFYCCALALGGWAPNLWTHLYVMPTAEVIGVVSPTPGGMGALEWAIQKAYGAAAQGNITVNQAEEAGFLAALTFRLVNMTIAGIGGLLYLTTGRGALQTILNEATHPHTVLRAE